MVRATTGTAGSVTGVGLLFVLRCPQPRSKSLRRATRAQRREQRRADAQEWTAATEQGRLLDVPVEVLLPLADRVGTSRLTVIGQLDPWSDGVLHGADLPRLEADVERLAAAASSDAERQLVTAVQALLSRWHAEPDLLLHWYGD